MKHFLFIAVFLFFISSVFGQKYILDSTETHPYIKLTSYAFKLHQKKQAVGLALGPSISLSGKKIEVQLGLLRDFAKQQIWNGTSHSPQYFRYHPLYFTLLMNYNFLHTKRGSYFLSFGAITRRGLFLGVGGSHKIKEKIKLSLKAQAEFYGLFYPAVIFEIAYQLN